VFKGFDLLVVCTLAATISADAHSGAQARPPQQTPQPTVTRIHGRVIAADSGVPLRGVTVRITAGDTGGETTSDAGGAFEFRNTRNANFTLTLTKGGYVTQTYRAASPIGGRVELMPAQSDRILIATVAGSALELPDLRLPRGGVIAGRILDPDGEPMANAAVTALRMVYPRPGAPDLTTGGFDHTNDLGEYRIFGLQPGTYFVVTGGSYQPAAMATVSVGAATARSSTFSAIVPAYARNGPTYFPGTALAAEARAIPLAPGDQALGTDFRLMSMTYGEVSGRVLDSRGQPAADTTVVLSIPKPAGAHVARTQAVATDPEGNYSFGAVPPGYYRVDAIALATAGVAVQHRGDTGAGAGRAVAEFATEEINVTGDLRVDLTSRPGFEIRGRVLVDGVVAPALTKTVGIEAFPTGDYRKLMTLGSGVEEDGSFAIGLVAGHRLIRVTGLPADMAVQRIVARGVDVTDAGIDVKDAGYTDLVVHLTSRPSRLEGDIVDSAGRSAASDAVIVFSEDSRLWTIPDSRHVRRVSATSGKLNLSGLPPGRYLVAVAPEFDVLEWADPLNLERLRPYAGSVALADGTTTTVRLTVR
jgi:protocatechuate 3,4-dioxygenase beta subunit